MHAFVHNEWQAFAEPLGAEVYPQGEAAPQMTRGRPLQAFRVGPLHSRRTGEKLIDVTDEMLAEVVRVFRATQHDRAVAIDWAHGPDKDAPAEQAMSLGRVVDLIHQPGRGLWAVPEYTERGRAIVEQSAGVLYTSPAFTPASGKGSVYSAADGSVVGFVQMLGLALTNRPVQDRLEPARLSEDTTTDSPPDHLVSRHGSDDDRPTAYQPGDRVRVKGKPHMDGQSEGTVATSEVAEVLSIDFGDGMGPHKWYVADELEPADQSAPPKKHQMNPGAHRALAEITDSPPDDLIARHDTTPAESRNQEAAMTVQTVAASAPAEAVPPIPGEQASQISPEEFAALKTERDALAARIAQYEQANATQTAALSERSADVRTLAEQVAALKARTDKAEADAAAERKARVLDGLQVNEGLFADGDREHMSKLYDVSPALFAERVEQMRKSPAVDLRRRTTSAAPATGGNPADAFNQRVLGLMAERKITNYADAATLLLSEHPELSEEAV